MSRLPPLDPDAFGPAQKAVYESIAGGARGGVRGPFLALLHSPDLAARVEQLGVYIRYNSAVPERLRELAILVVARHWRSDYEWYAHFGLAVKQGVPSDALAQLGRGDEPEWDRGEDALTHRFCASLLRDGEVDDALYAKATDMLGQQGVVDLVGLVGYYTLLALTLNAHVVQVPPDAAIPWR